MILYSFSGPHLSSSPLANPRARRGKQKAPVKYRPEKLVSWQSREEIDRLLRVVRIRHGRRGERRTQLDEGRQQIDPLNETDEINTQPTRSNAAAGQTDAP